MNKHAKCVQVISLLAIFSGCAHKDVTNKNSVKTTYFHQYGPEVSLVEWMQRGGNGQVVRILKNGSMARQTYRDGVLHGLSTYTFPHSEIIQQESFYEEGRLLWQTVNYSSGVPQKQESYKHNGVMHVATWYEDGTPASREEMHDGLLVMGQYFGKNQALASSVEDAHGLRVIHDRFGVMQAKEHIVSGVCVFKEELYPNGMPSAYVDYLDGKVHGVRKTFNPGGDPKAVEEWKNGLLDGITLLFENGEKVASIPYVQGVKEGKEQRFKPGTNVVVEEISWKNDKLHGPSIATVEKKKFTTWYFQGKKVSKVEFAELDRGTNSRVG